MDDHLSALDATFLELEEAADGTHMHLGALLIFDPLPDGGIPSVQRVRAQLQQRLELLPRYRQKLSEPRTGGLTWPAWEQDARFDLSRHVRRAALPPPGGQAELDDWASDYWSQRLDRSRPLWEVVLLSGLDGGRWALATKTHQCLADGVGWVDAAQLLLDPDRKAPAKPPPAVPEGDAQGGARAQLPGWMGAPARPALRRSWLGVDPVRPRTRVIELLERSRAALEPLVRDEVEAAPKTSLNQPLGARRRYTTVSVAVDEVKAITHTRGGTVNDAVLAATAGGVRRLLRGRGEQPPPSLRAMRSMSIREAGEQLSLGNRISSLFVELGAHEPDDVERHRRIAGHVSTLERDGQGGGSPTAMAPAGLAPPVLHAALARAVLATRLFNLTITNVPASRQTLYAFGAPLREVHPLVPLAAEHAVGVAIASYDGTLFFGLIADHASVPDLDVMARGIDDALHALSIRSVPPGRSDRRSRRHLVAVR